jgi:UDP-N-acetylglucosamine 1-carboxyvinyltransferase
MAFFRVVGGQPLRGEWHLQGSKNEAAMALCAALLTTEPVQVRNIPELNDLDTLLRLLAGLNVRVSRVAADEIVLEARDLDVAFLGTPEYRRLFSSIRASVNLIGPLLARFGRATVPPPGGDRIGGRKLDSLVRGLRRLGVEARYDEATGGLNLRAGGSREARVLLEEASVTGTAVMMMLCAAQQGTTELFNAACEPYLEQLGRMNGGRDRRDWDKSGGRHGVSKPRWVRTPRCSRPDGSREPPRGCRDYRFGDRCPGGREALVRIDPRRVRAARGAGGLV